MITKFVFIKENDRLRDFTGVTKFHNAGYYGSRVIAASGESWSTDIYNPYGNVLDPLNKGTGDGHSVETAATFFQVAPLAKLVQLPIFAIDKGDGSYVSGLIEDSMPIIKEMKINNMFWSVLTSPNKNRAEAEKKALQEVESYFKLFVCAGNDSSSKYNKMMEIDEVCGVAAYHLVGTSPNPAYYSSDSKYVDFSAPSLVYIDIDATESNSNAAPCSGTSFSTPWLCGMACLVDDFFIDKTGVPLSREKMMQFFKDNCKDIYYDGFDNKTGYGAVILPDPSTIDIDKYRSDNNMLDQFNDKDQISSWAKDSVSRCISNGLMNGKGEGFDPKGTLTREELACVVDRMYSKLEEKIMKYIF